MSKPMRKCHCPTRSYVAALSSLLCLACSGGGSSSFNAEKSPYGERTPTTQLTSTLNLSLSALLTSPDIVQTTTVVGQKTIGGKSYDRLATLNVNDTTQGGEYWIKENPDGTVDFAGFDLHSNLAAALIPSGSMVFDTPLSVKKEAPVGQAQTVTLTGTYTPAGATTGTAVSASGQYTLTEKDAVVQTKLGPVAGCSHYTGSASSTSTLVPTIFQGVTVSAELWLHPSFGVVAFKAPALGIESTMNDTNDCGEVDSSGHRTIRKVAIVDQTSNKFELSSYDCTGEFDADKTVHAKMLLELRFKDETAAKTTTMPSNSYQFQTALGYFPSMLVQSPVSILHPEENGKGFVYWIAYVDQAAKNEPGSNGISYGVSVSPAASGVRASARIYYKTFP
jgi:hypothetical protein